MDNSSGSAIFTSACIVLIALYVVYDKIRKDNVKHREEHNKRLDSLVNALQEQKKENVKQDQKQQRRHDILLEALQEHEDRSSRDREEQRHSLDALQQKLKEQGDQTVKDRGEHEKRLEQMEKKLKEHEYRSRPIVLPSTPVKTEPDMESFGECQSPALTFPRDLRKDLLEYMRDANPVFHGLEDIIEKIHQSYTKNKPQEESIDPTKRKTVVHIINGLAGCGKSEIAIQYVNTYYKQYKGVVLWILAGSTDTLDYAFQQTFAKLQLHGIFEEGTDFRADYVQRAVIDWLEGISDWLLVLDNADSAECIYDYFPKFPDGGHIIITSRDKNFKSSLYPTIKAPFDVHPLKQEDAELLLAKSFYEEPGEASISLDAAKQKLHEMKENEPENYKALRWLASPDGLDGLPLALNAATRYMKENERSFVEYKEYSETCVTPHLFPELDDDPLKAWLRKIKLVKYYESLKALTKSSLTAFLKLGEEDISSEEIGMTESEVIAFMEERKHDVNINKWMYKRKRVLATWSLTFRNYDHMEYGPAAMELLQLCVYLTPTISENIITEGAEFITLETLREELLKNVESRARQSDKIVQVQRNLDKILQCLRRYSLIESLPTVDRGNQSNRKFTIHRVVRKAIKTELDEEKVLNVISCAVSLLTNLIPSYDEIYTNFTGHYKPLPKAQEVTMHVVCLSRNLRQEWLDSARGKIEDPVPLLNAAALYLECFKSRLDEAKKLYAKALQCTMKLSTTQDPMADARKRASVHCQIGRILLELDERKEALSHLEAAGEDISKCCSPEDYDSDIDVAKYHYLMARAHESEYIKLEKNPPDNIKQKIEEDIEKAISISKKYYGKCGEEDGEWTALSMHELALFHLQMGRRNMQNIERLLKGSLEIKQRIWRTGSNGDHVSIAIGMTDLARFYILNQDEAKYEEIEKLLLKALKMKERVLPQYQHSESWQLGVYYLIRLYILMKREDDEKQYREKLKKVDTKRSFDDLFQASDPYKAYPPDVILWSRNIL